jgi:hypothetical protein
MCLPTTNNNNGGTTMKRMSYDEMDAVGMRFREEFPMTAQENQMVTSGARKFSVEGKVSQGSCESGSVPTPETMTPTEAKPFTHREGVHQFHDYQPTMWTMKHCKDSAQHTTADTVAHSVTKMTGRADKSQWKTNGTTKRGVKRMAEKQARAQKWAAKFDR